MGCVWPCASSTALAHLRKKIIHAPFNLLRREKFLDGSERPGMSERIADPSVAVAVESVERRRGRRRTGIHRAFVHGICQQAFYDRVLRLFTDVSTGTARPGSRPRRSSLRSSAEIPSARRGRPPDTPSEPRLPPD